MSFKEIQTLRKAGKLEDALEMASQALANDPDNIWNKRSAAWVYYEYLKKNTKPNTVAVFSKFLTKLKDLQLPEGEKMVFDSCAWQIGKMVFALQKSEPIDYGRINELFETIKTFHFTKPAESYTFLYKAFHKGYKKWSKYLEFARWWDFENFDHKDYLKEEHEGKKIMAIVEQAYIAYAKKLLDGESSMIKARLGEMEKPEWVEAEKIVDRDRIKDFLPRLDRVINEHPEYQYNSYYKAKLLLSSGEDENLLSAFLPFAKQKRNEFWMWELMADIFPKDTDRQFICYCKALSLKTPEDFLVKLRQTFAAILVEKQMYCEAKAEIQQVIDTREKHEWKMPNQIKEWVKAGWYPKAIAPSNNKKLYSRYLKAADDILFYDVEEEVVVVEFVNRNKKMLSFVKNKQMFGFFNYSSHLDKPEVGDVLKVRLMAKGNDGYYKILTATKATPDTPSDAVKRFDGTLKVIEPKNIVFVDDVFVDPKLITDNELTNCQYLTGIAMLSFNKKKNEWGWKAIRIIDPS